MRTDHKHSRTFVISLIVSTKDLSASCDYKRSKTSLLDPFFGFTANCKKDEPQCPAEKVVTGHEQINFETKIP